MSWWVWVVIIAIGFIVLGSLFDGEEEKTSSQRKSKTPKNNKTAKQIAKEVQTISQLRALENKLEKADKKRHESQAYDSRSLKAAERTEDRYQLLQEAYDLASNKIFRWQFIPNIDLHTNLNVAKNAYKIFSQSEYENKLQELGGNKDAWFGLRGDEEPDEKDEEIDFIIKFRTIVENTDITDEEKDKKINLLISRNIELASNYFDTESSKTAADQWHKEST